MFKAFKFRLEPNTNQARELEIMLETHRRLYNECLEQRKTAWETEKKSVRYTDQSAWFTQARKTNDWYGRINFSSAQATMRRLDLAFKAFFRRIKAGETPGYPRFKGRDRFDAVVYPSVGDGAKIVGNKLRLQHVGLVRINLHRAIEGQIKTITVKKQVEHWYVVASCEVPDVSVQPNDKPFIGIDVGLESFVTLSTGEQVPPIKPLKQALKRLRVAQRSLSRKKKGGSNRRKQKVVVARIHAKVSNTRRDAHHKIASDLVNRFGGIVVESLNIQGMVKNHKLARAISDAGWSQFVGILEHKAEGAGVEFIKVDARFTSQTCPACGSVVKKTLSQRWHVCECGFKAHRDHAAAQVILDRGMRAGTQPVSLNAGSSRHGSGSRLL